jgi:hypothetical protein
VARIIDTPDSFAAALLKAAVEVVPTARAVVERGAANLKDRARENVRRSAPRHNAHAADAITYDVDLSRFGVSAEIGYDKDRPGGPLGNLLEYGGHGDRSPAHRDLGRALDEEERRFPDVLAAAAERLL